MAKPWAKKKEEWRAWFSACFLVAAREIIASSRPRPSAPFAATRCCRVRRVRSPVNHVTTLKKVFRQVGMFLLRVQVLHSNKCPFCNMPMIPVESSAIVLAEREMMVAVTCCER